MSDKNSSGMGSESQASGVGQTASIGRSTSVSSGAAKVFREFKWGLLTLFLLMVVVVGLVYDGGAKKKLADKPKTHDPAMDINLDGMAATPPSTPGGAPNGDTLLAPIPGADTGTGTPTTPGNPLDYAANPPGLPGTVPTPPAQFDRAPSTYPHTTELTFNGGINDVVAQPTQPTQPTQPPAPVEPAPVAKKTYTVKSGETLSSIASSMKLGKGGLKALIAANKTTLPNPDRVKPGMVLNVPEMASTTTTKPAEANTTVKTDIVDSQPKTTPKTEVPTAKTGGSEYTVQSGDTLERIARKFFNDERRWKEIHSWNRDKIADPSRLRIGQVLKIKQLTDATSTTSGKPAKPAKVSEAEDVAPADEPKTEVVETLPQPETVKEKTVAVKEKKAKKVSVKEIEPQVEVMSSAFAP